MDVVAVAVANLITLVGLFYGLRVAVANDVSLDFFAYLITIVGLFGLIPRYLEIIKYQRVLGVSLGVKVE